MNRWRSAFEAAVTAAEVLVAAAVVVVVAAAAVVVAAAVAAAAAAAAAIKWPFAAAGFGSLRPEAGAAEGSDPTQAGT